MLTMWVLKEFGISFLVFCDLFLLFFRDFVVFLYCFNFFSFKLYIYSYIYNGIYKLLGIFWIFVCCLDCNSILEEIKHEFFIPCHESHEGFSMLSWHGLEWKIHAWGLVPTVLKLYILMSWLLVCIFTCCFGFCYVLLIYVWRFASLLSLLCLHSEPTLFWTCNHIFGTKAMNSSSRP